MKIHAIRQNEFGEESENDSFQAKRCHEIPRVNSIQVCRPPMVQRFYSSHLKTWLPWSLHQSQFVGASPEVKAIDDPGVDIRPHIFDPVLQKFILCDSGSQVSALPPDPGDKVIANKFLKAANGTRIQCYGTKEIEIKLGRKNFKFNIIKADIESPILGWDFFKANKVDLRWNDRDEITLYDKVSNIQKELVCKTCPVGEVA